MLLVFYCSCFCPSHWCQVLSREWRRRWNSADRRCPNYICVINNYIHYLGWSYIDVSRHSLIHKLSKLISQSWKCNSIMMTSSNGNILRVTGHLCEEFTVPRWIARTKASDAEFWCVFFICVWINCWLNNREAGDFRRYWAHYDVIVMGKYSQLA